VHNYGAGDSLEIAPEAGEAFLVPFTKARVPKVDIVGKSILIVPDEG
jgi:16S rRNA processing protein RimM